MTFDPRETGWAHNALEGFMGHIGGLWERQVDDVIEFGFLAEPLHANRNDVVHGGMLMTFIDRAFGQTARQRSGARRAATISLNVQFMAPMPIGGFATLRPSVTRQTARLCFIEGLVMCEEEALVSALGVWRLATKDRHSADLPDKVESASK